MTRPRKDYKNLTIKLDSVIAEELEQYCDEVGQTKTMAIERILKAYFDDRKKQTEEKE